MPNADILTEASAPPNAARFIVTVYGDVVEPRGGVLWMGSLIAVCGLAGLSESLVRTAVSRLVAAGRLEGERQGRRSYYRLTRDGAVEFARAAELIFGGAKPPSGWRLVQVPGAEAATRLTQQGYVRIGPGYMLGADSGPAPDDATLSLRAEAETPDLVAWAADLWPLGDLADRYRAFLSERSGDLAAEGLGPSEALAARLMLVEDWRRILLCDPRLPGGALPRDWPARPAARAFARRYIALSEAADAAISELCEATGGAGLPVTPALAQRRGWLERMAR